MCFSGPGMATAAGVEGLLYMNHLSASCQFFKTGLFLCIFEEIDSFVMAICSYFLSNRIWLRSD